MKMTETLQTINLQFSSISPQILEKYEKKRKEKRLRCVSVHMWAHTRSHMYALNPSSCLGKDRKIENV